jgi:hypothetical protein
VIAMRAEPHFHLAWPPWQPPGVDGLAAIVAPGASTAWADGLLARTDDGLVVWAATGAEPEAQAVARLQYPGVRAVTLAPARSDPRRVRLGLDLAVHLATVRHNGAGEPAPPERPPPAAGGTAVGSAGAGTPRAAAGVACLTSWAPPTPPPGVVRIPHLVTIHRDGVVTDTVVWELATVAVAQHWLGGPLPDQAFVEAHLDTLLWLRGAARRGQLPATAVAAGLADLLRGRDLSIRLVYEHPALFRTLLGGRPRAPRRHSL